MLHQEKVIIAQHAIPEDTNEITQVRELLDRGGLAGAVVTGDAAHAQRETARYIAGPAKETEAGNRTISCSSRETSRACSAPSTMHIKPAARASQTTSRSITATAGS